MLRILTVCTGNVCRSPLAQALLADRLAGLPVVIESAGMRALVDHPMTEETQRLATDHGIRAEVAESHRARLATEPILESADLILALAREHRHGVVDLVPRRLRATFTLRELARLAREATDQELAGEVTGVTDPQERLRLLLAFVSSLRGTIGPPDQPEDDDVIDPYRRSWETYTLSASQLVPAVDDVARLLRFAVGGGTAGTASSHVKSWAPSERHSWN